MDNAFINECKALLEKERNLLVEELTTIADPNPAMTGDWNARFPKFEVGETSSSSGFFLPAL